MTKAQQELGIETGDVSPSSSSGCVFGILAPFD